MSNGSCYFINSYVGCMNDVPDNCSHSDCGCFVAGYDLSGVELSQLVLDRSNCTLHFSEESESEK